MSALCIIGSGMVSAVGLSAPASCAAIRCAIDNFQETRFIDQGGEWLIAASVPLEQSWRGRTKLIKMAARAIAEALQSTPGSTRERPRCCWAWPKPRAPAALMASIKDCCRTSKLNWACAFILTPTSSPAAESALP